MREQPAPEPRLVLLSAGGPENDGAMRALLARPLDVGAVIRLAERENAVSVLLERVRSLGGGGDELEEALARLSIVSAFRQARIANRLDLALEHLERAGVSVLLLKGVAMAAAYYGGVQGRPMRDIDLLVRPDDALRAYHAMRDAGWAVRGQEADVLARYARHHHLPPLVDPAGSGIGVELHTALFPDGNPFLFDGADLWARARTALVNGRSVAVPHPHDLALHACTHLAWSNWLRGGAWRTFRDLRHITSGPDFDWAEFVRRAIAARATTSCYWTLRLARRLAAITVPDAVLAELRPRLSAPLASLIERHYACDVLPFDAGCPSDKLRYLVWTLAIQPGRSGHGAIRPWRIDPAGTTSKPAPRRPAHRFRRWRRYIAALGRATARTRIDDA